MSQAPSSVLARQSTTRDALGRHRSPPRCGCGRICRDVVVPDASVTEVRFESERDPDVTPVSLQRAYMLVSGCHQTIIRAVARGEKLTELAGEIKAVMKSALAGHPAQGRG